MFLQASVQGLGTMLDGRKLQLDTLAVLPDGAELPADFKVLGRRMPMSTCSAAFTRHAPELNEYV